MIPAEDSDRIRRERISAIGLLLLIATFTVLDIIEDLDEGSTLAHVLTECAIISLCFGAGIYLWRGIVRNWRNQNSVLRSELRQSSADTARWKASTESLARGLTQAIDQQLDIWCLSPAEREVAFLLIKGLSVREIAAARSTSEGTVRQQSATIYRKSGLEGRAQLSAFFLEDLFVFTPETPEPKERV